MGIKSALDILVDNRFSWRFKLANLILNDDLRLNLVFARHNLEEALQFFPKTSPLCTTLSQRKIEHAIRLINELWKYPEIDD